MDVTDLNAQEAATYRLLVQVLQTHLSTYPISWEVAISACGALVSTLARPLVAAGADPQALGSALVTRLKDFLLARHAQPPCLHERTDVDPDLPAALVQEHLYRLSDALLLLLWEAGVEYHLRVKACVQIALHLTAAALHGFVHQQEDSSEDSAAWFEECIAEGMTQVLSRVLARVEQGQ